VDWAGQGRATGGDRVPLTPTVDLRTYHAGERLTRLTGIDVGRRAVVRRA
jgi:hypothetical protein